ncbi:hypothetical protein 6937_0048 [Klebsiella phage 6937]|uniref:Uncharacterized protein n=1 Tax=Klebsiella phage 6937 TaxID=2912294 RepID=A0A9E7M7E9_9CAUD|nr:hypothetical protein 6937_0048 [Klebsiella phage 6937]
MAGILLTAGGLDLSKYANGMVFPYMDTCAYMNIFTRGVDLTRNLAPGKKRASLVGSPTFNDGYVRFNNQNYLQTDVDHTNEYAIVAVSRAPDPSAESMVVSNYGSDRTDGFGTGTTNGMSFMHRASTSGFANMIQFYRRAGDTSDKQGGPSLSNAEGQRGKFILHLMSTRGAPGSSGQYIGLWDATGGMRNNNAPMNDTTFARGSKLRVGGAYAFGANTGADIAFVGIWNRAMTDAELVAVRDFARTVVGFNGITV